MSEGVRKNLNALFEGVIGLTAPSPDTMPKLPDDATGWPREPLYDMRDSASLPHETEEFRDWLAKCRRIITLNEPLLNRGA
jgi:hypothetical protein